MTTRTSKSELDRISPCRSGTRLVVDRKRDIDHSAAVERARTRVSKVMADPKVREILRKHQAKTRRKREEGAADKPDLPGSNRKRA